MTLPVVVRTTLLVAVAATVALGCRTTYRAEPIAHAPPDVEVDVDVDAVEDPWEQPVPTNDVPWHDDFVIESINDWIDPEPLPQTDGPHMLLRLVVPAMMCTNCERAVTRLCESLPRTRVIAIDHEADEVHLLIPVAVAGRVIRLLSINGWRVLAAESEVEIEPGEGPFRMAEPYQHDREQDLDDDDN